MMQLTKMQDYILDRTKHMSNEELGDMLGITAGMVSKYKNHEHHLPPLYLAVKVYQLTAGTVLLYPYDKRAILEEIENER